MARGLASRLLLAFARLWMRTWRIRSVPDQLPAGGVLALWHEHLPACIPAFAGRSISVLISRSADGSVAAAECARLGYRVHRGSSSGGSVGGTRPLARVLAKEGGLVGMALDGPRGPRRAVKPGTPWLAARAGVPVHPIAVKASRAFRLGTWDRTLIPLPFARVDVRLGPPCHPEDGEALRAAMDANQAALDAGLPPESSAPPPAPAPRPRASARP